MTRWFRMYDEILDDPKVQMLTPDTFRTWVNLLAVASRNNGKLPPVATLAFSLRMSVQDMQAKVDELVLAALIDIGPDGSLSPHNWARRQWKSDDSAERVKRHREKKKQAETAEKPACNATVTVTVTPPDTESDTDTEIVSPLTPLGAKKDEPRPVASKPKCDPEGVRIERGTITLDDGNREFWLEMFGGDGERLDLALIQAFAYVQPNSPRPLAAQVGAQLARYAADRRDRDRRYQAAAVANRDKPTVKNDWVAQKNARASEFLALLNQPSGAA
jgi:hypothetical protein